MREFPLCSSEGPSANYSYEFFVQECLGLFFTVSHHPLDESWVAVQLRFGIKIPQHLDPLQLDDLVLGARKSPTATHSLILFMKYVS